MPWPDRNVSEHWAKKGNLTSSSWDFNQEAGAGSAWVKRSFFFTPRTTISKKIQPRIHSPSQQKHNTTYQTQSEQQSSSVESLKAEIIRHVKKKLNICWTTQTTKTKHKIFNWNVNKIRAKVVWRFFILFSCWPFGPLTWRPFCWCCQFRRLFPEFPFDVTRLFLLCSSIPQLRWNEGNGIHRNKNICHFFSSRWNSHDETGNQQRKVQIDSGAGSLHFRETSSLEIQFWHDSIDSWRMSDAKFKFPRGLFQVKGCCDTIEMAENWTIKDVQALCCVFQLSLAAPDWPNFLLPPFYSLTPRSPNSSFSLSPTNTLLLTAQNRKGEVRWWEQHKNRPELRRG